MDVQSSVIAPYVMNDIVIREDNCNLACEYCLTGQSMFKSGHVDQMIFDPPTPDSCLPGTNLYKNLHSILDANDTQQIPVVKISGGEVMLIRGIMEFIEELSNRYETVVLLTNGVLLTEQKIEKLLSLENIVVQISLDSTRYEGNSYRVRSEKFHNKIMSRLYDVFASGLAVEIYMVLNNRSMATFRESLDDLLPYTKNDLRVFPFPVRGPNSNQFRILPEQYKILKKIIIDFEQYQELLPSMAFMKRLEQFLDNNGRTFRCHVPRMTFTTFDDGIITSCPIIWFNKIGNLLEESAETVFEDAVNAPFRSLLLSPQPRIDACKDCFNPLVPLTLYCNGDISLAELARSRVYRGERTKMRLQMIKAQFEAQPEGLISPELRIL